MRARFALLLAQQTVQIRAITMKDKPEHMVTASPKATVPVLIVDNDTPQETVIDESLDIMLWALKRNDPDNLLYTNNPLCTEKDSAPETNSALEEMLQVIQENDDHFKPNLEQYKRAKRFHGEDLEECRLQCEPFIQKLEQRLSKNEFFMGNTPSLLDYALLSFIRQFSKVNKTIFAQDEYKNLRRWLRYHLDSRLFARAMLKYPLWLETGEGCLLGGWLGKED